MNLHVYAWNLNKLAMGVLLGCALWGALNFWLQKKRLFRVACGILTGIAIYWILAYTVLGRTPTGERQFVLFAEYTNEFWREMFMNGLLYVPLGMALTVWAGKASVLIGCLLSLAIEGWQYFAGAGTAQGTDVLMNALGCAVGALPVLAAGWIRKRYEMKVRPRAER